MTQLTFPAQLLTAPVMPCVIYSSWLLCEMFCFTEAEMLTQPKCHQLGGVSTLEDKFELLSTGCVKLSIMTNMDCMLQSSF